MKPFAYAAPRTEGDCLTLLADAPSRTVVLAGGTDLVPLMQAFLVTPSRVVNIKEIGSLSGISADSQGVTIGAATSLEEIADSALLAPYAAVVQAIAGINSHALQAQGTLGGELLQWPRCWYFRNGHGLTADAGRLVTQGDNRFHAILGNSGPAKFCSASRIAPALIALGAQVRIIGPGPDDEMVVPVENLYRVPRAAEQREVTLDPGQLVTHIQLPAADSLCSATYEVRHGEGPDDPLAAAAVALQMSGDVVADARIVLGHVAPMPWPVAEASRRLVGQRVTPELAESIAAVGLEQAAPLSGNEYKVQLAQVAVKRALLRAVELPTGGF